MMRRTAVLACWVGSGWGCAAGDAAQLATVAGEAEPMPAAAYDTAVTRADVSSELSLVQPGALWMVLSAPVHGRTGPDGVPFEVALRTVDAPHARSFGRRTLAIALRTNGSSVAQYPCTSCHAGSRIEMSDDRIEDAHADLRISHPRETGATCSTCHSAADVELLTLRNGERATLDHAYRVCAQCHFAQADAWAAGAHGKRLDGWQGRRVVMGCTDCHDPHAPALQPRLPFRPPTLIRAGGSSHER